MKNESLRSSRHRYGRFVQDYRLRRLDDADANAERKARDGADGEAATSSAKDGAGKGRRREFLREYLRWLKPHRYAVGAVFGLALLAAGLQMIEPLFMRFIIDRVLLNETLDGPQRLRWLNLAGGAFLTAIVVSNLLNALKDYRQRLLNVRVMLSLRRSLFDRFLHLPLPKLYDMKSGGILSRVTG
jgi:ATP-binding cassette subfamily B protein/subfamily B ATP-binding cassette protein MsbA